MSKLSATWIGRYVGLLLGTVMGLMPLSSAPPKSTTLYGFPGEPAGSFPEGGVAVGPSGVVYGTTWAGGAYGWGTIFEVLPPASQGQPWTQKTLYNFTGGADGANPSGSIALASDSVIYGTTYQGGTTGYGTVYELTPFAGGVWTEKTLYTFRGGSDGANPQSGVTLSTSFILYGTTVNGGTPGYGTVFSLSPVTGGSWNEFVLYTFNGGTIDGANPQAPPILSSSGLYGTTPAGGASGFGTVYQITVTGGNPVETILYSFMGSTDGATPQSSLVLGSGGVLYGSAYYGGGTGCALGGYVQGCGTIFELAPPINGGTTWTYSVIHQFSGTGTDGAYPYGPLALTAGGALYGSTVAGGNTSDVCFPASFVGCGTVYRFRPPSGTGGSWSGGTMTAFNGSNGGGPNGVALYSKTGALFGTTYTGGSQGPGYGTVFEVVP